MGAGSEPPGAASDATLDAGYASDPAGKPGPVTAGVGDGKTDPVPLASGESYASQLQTVGVKADQQGPGAPGPSGDMQGPSPRTDAGRADRGMGTKGEERQALLLAPNDGPHLAATSPALLLAALPAQEPGNDALAATSPAAPPTGVGALENAGSLDGPSLERSIGSDRADAAFSNVPHFEGDAKSREDRPRAPELLPLAPGALGLVPTLVGGTGEAERNGEEAREGPVEPLLVVPGTGLDVETNEAPAAIPAEGQGRADPREAALDALFAGGLMLMVWEGGPWKGEMQVAGRGRWGRAGSRASKGAGPGAPR